MITDEQREIRDIDAPDERNAPDTAERNPARLRVLIVEDDRATRSAMRRIVTFAGHDVRAVETLAEGLGLLAWPPDCVILDLMLPDGCGLALLRRVRDEGLPVGVAVCTASNNPAVLAEAARLRPERTILKPCNVDDLLAWLRSEEARMRG
jgi:two-component system OmpR family response regulator